MQPQHRPTPLDRAMERARMEAEAFDRMQEDFLRGEDHQAPIRELMFLSGRVASPIRPPAAPVITTVSLPEPIPQDDDDEE